MSRHTISRLDIHLFTYVLLYIYMYNGFSDLDSPHTKTTVGGPMVNL